MDELLIQIESSLNNGEFYLALFVSLTMPDICGALSSENGKASGVKYKGWFDKYVAKKYGENLDGGNCYAFRCSVLHQGKVAHKKLGYSKILFADPNSASDIIMHNNILNDALNVDIRQFCQDIVEGVRAWLEDIVSDEFFNANYKHFLQRYEGGLPPYISGVDVYG